MSVEKRHDGYYVSFKDPSTSRRRRIKIHSTSRKLALEEDTRIKYLIKTGRFEKEYDRPTLRLSEAIDQYIPFAMNKVRSLATIIIALKRFVDILGNKPLVNIGPLDIEKFKTEAVKNMKPNSVNRELDVIRAFFNDLVFLEILPFNHLERKIKHFRGDFRRDRIPTPEEMEIIFEFLRTYQTQGPLRQHHFDEFRMIVLIAIFAGLRAKEITTLTLDRVDLDKGFFFIVQSKTQNFVAKPIHPILKEVLTRYIQEKEITFKLFHTSNSQASSRWIYYMKELGIKNLRFHDLRAYFGTTLSESGVPVSIIQKLLGHRDIKMTERYVRYADPYLTRAVNQMCIPEKLTKQIEDSM